METLRHSYLSRSHLLTMAMFAQEAVDLFHQIVRVGHSRDSPALLELRPGMAQPQSQHR